MNLFDLYTRKDRNFIASAGVEPAKRTFFGDTWRGFKLSPGSEFRVVDIMRFYPVKAWPDFCGWYVDIPASGCDVEIGFAAGGGDALIARRTYTGGKGAAPVQLPWPFDTTVLPAKVDLVVRTSAARRGAGEPVFFAVHRALTRDALFAAAKGTGIEIGPGHNPQILPAPDIQVSYLEQMPPEEWNRLYNTHGKYPVKKELWNHYVIGEASKLPVEDGSLDFIFASHVFEHLANPFGHLLHWRSKLKPNGIILCVVPDLCGTKDAQQMPSEMSEWQREWKEDIWEPELAHYKRHMRVAMPDQDPEQMMAQRRSIHVHYFTNTTMEILLRFACRELGFAWFKINYTANHKDFHFMLRRSP